MEDFIIVFIYTTGLIVQLFNYITFALGHKGTKFSGKWVLDCILINLLWPFTMIASLAMAIFLRSQGQYTFDFYDNERERGKYKDHNR